MREFIKNNNISFKEGNRNSSVVVLIGYAQHLGMEQEELEKQLAKEIKKDKFIGEEIQRLWLYCENNNYKMFWKKAAAKKKYTF